MGKGRSLPPDCILNYLFNNNLLDSSAKANHLGLTTGSYSFVNDHKGNPSSAIKILTTATRLITNAKVNLSAGTTMTICFWLKGETSNANWNPYFYTNNNASTDNYFQADIQNSVIAFELCTAGTWNSKTTGPGFSNTGVWNHIAYTYNRSLGGTNEGQCYVNGVESYGALLINDLTGNLPNIELIFGGLIYSMSDFRIYNTIKTQAQILAIANE